MSQSHSVSQWIDKLKAGGETAAAELWNRYYVRLIGLARKKLGNAPRRVADEEDVVVSALESFFGGARANRFPSLHDRTDLWHLIVRITERKAYDQLRAQLRKKRGAGKVAGESALADREGSDIGAGIEQVASPEPTPEFAAQTVETVDRLLRMLDDDELRRIAVLKLQGYQHDAIAEEVGRSVPTIERRVRLIRTTWKQEVGDG